jgi:DNA-binding LytR/AlgR family response regulator
LGKPRVPANQRPSKDQQATTLSQGDGGGRSIPWGLLRGRGVSGALFGADGELRAQFMWGLAAVALLVVINNTGNVITILHDLPKVGLFAAIVWEGSSGVSTLACLWIPWLAYRLAPPDAPPLWRIGAVHIPAALLYSLSHVTLFVILRQAVYLAAGSHYGTGPLTEEFDYELRKDALSYVLISAIFWSLGRLMTRSTATPVAEPAPPAFFDIRDGARLTRVRIDEILAVTSADNYVEFVLADGRRLMMRKALSAIESELASRGFLRTHRSWLVNAARMTALKPEGSGDYKVELGSLTVPLSRRFPEALVKLRAG